MKGVRGDLLWLSNRIDFNVSLNTCRFQKDWYLEHSISMWFIVIGASQISRIGQGYSHSLVSYLQ